MLYCIFYILNKQVNNLQREKEKLKKKENNFQVSNDRKINDTFIKFQYNKIYH